MNSMNKTKKILRHNIVSLAMHRSRHIYIKRSPTVSIFKKIFWLRVVPQYKDKQVNNIKYKYIYFMLFTCLC